MTKQFVTPNDTHMLVNSHRTAINNRNNQFGANKQRRQLEKQFHNSCDKKITNNNELTSHQNKQQQNLSQDHQIPKKLQPTSTINKKAVSLQKQTYETEHNKQNKKLQKRIFKKKNIQTQKNKKQMISNAGQHQIIKQAQKNVEFPNKQAQQKFHFKAEKSPKEQQNHTQRLQTKKPTQEAIKKNQTPSSSTNKSQPTASSLKIKLDKVKRHKLQGTVLGQSYPHHSKNQANEQQIIKSSNHYQVKQNQKKDQQMDIRPKLGKQFLRQSKFGQKIVSQQKQQITNKKNTSQIDLNKYFESLMLPQVQLIHQNQKNQNGFFQSLCVCLSPKKKGYTRVEKQLLKLSLIQLTNQPESIALLQSIWTKITNKKYIRYGQHWTQIGFKNKDPSNDLRNTGILTLLTWYNFLTYNMQFPLKLYKFCAKFRISFAFFHIKITDLLCYLIKKRKLQIITWNDFLQWSDIITSYTFDYLIKKLKNINDANQLIEIALQRTKDNLEQAKINYTQNFNYNK